MLREGGCESPWLGSFTVAGGRCAGGFVVGVGAADEVDIVPHLSRPKLVPAGRVPELGWPWGLCTVAVKGVPLCRQPVS